MRVAIIDLGTNSVRFDVHSLGSRGQPRLLHREKAMIRLGQGVFVKGRLGAPAIERAVQAFARFRRVATAFGVRKMVAFGTSALREAQNGEELVGRVRAETGIDVKVISGKEEASLIALGILSHERVPKGRFALVDIGGGSTEISICRGKRVLDSNSFPLGTARLQQVFLKRSPPRPIAIKQLRAYIRNILGQRLGLGRHPRVSVVVGSSGTVRALAKMLGGKSNAFGVDELSELVARMETMSTSQLLHLPGLEAKRVDMILAGAVLLEEVAFALGAKTISPSDFSLRDGIIEEEKRLARAHKKSLIELHMEDLYTRAVRLGAEEAHTRRMTEFADELFHRLRPVHGLAPQWKIYLLSTVILRNCGEAVAYAGRERHSYYLVKNADFPSMQGWEHEFIARLCLLCPGGKVGSLSSIGNKQRREAFRKILALARVVDGLDLGPKTTLRLRGARCTRREVILRVDGPSTAGVEQLLVERKRKLFEEEFGRALGVQRGARPKS